LDQITSWGRVLEDSFSLDPKKGGLDKENRKGAKMVPMREEVFGTGQVRSKGITI